MAAFLGQEVMVKQLLDLRADTSLTCWFGEVQGEGGEGGINPHHSCRHASMQVYE